MFAAKILPLLGSPWQFLKLLLCCCRRTRGINILQVECAAVWNILHIPDIVQWLEDTLTSKLRGCLSPPKWWVFTSSGEQREQVVVWRVLVSRLSVFIYRKSRREAAGGGCVTAVRTNLCLTSVTVQPDVTVQTLPAGIFVLFALFPFSSGQM